MSKKFVLLFLCAACRSGTYVFTDYDSNADLRVCYTYNWTNLKDMIHPWHAAYSESNDQLIKSVVDDLLRERGYRRVEEPGDFELDYHFLVENVTAFKPDINFQHKNLSAHPDIAYLKYKEGTLVFDAMDLKSKRLLWRGYSTRALTSPLAPPSEQEIRQTIKKIFRKFPGRHIAQTLYFKREHVHGHIAPDKSNQHTKI